MATPPLSFSLVGQHRAALKERQQPSGGGRGGAAGGAARGRKAPWEAGGRGDSTAEGAGTAGLQESPSHSRRLLLASLSTLGT